MKIVGTVEIPWLKSVPSHQEDLLLNGRRAGEGERMDFLFLEARVLITFIL